MVERDFLNYFKENKIEIIGEKKNAILVDTEIPLLSLTTVLSQEYNSLNFEIPKHQMIGRIDLIFRIGAKKYIAEAKVNKDGYNNFWYSSKILAYLEYYKFQYGNKNTPHPAIILPKEEITLEHRMICGGLKMELFGLEKKSGAYTLEIVHF